MDVVEEIHIPYLHLLVASPCSLIICDIFIPVGKIPLPLLGIHTWTAAVAPCLWLVKSRSHVSGSSQHADHEKHRPSKSSGPRFIGPRKYQGLTYIYIYLYSMHMYMEYIYI